MTLSEIEELFETDSHKEANEHLRAGWILISTYVRDTSKPSKRDEKTIYCLGWPREQDRAVLPTQYGGREFPSG